MICPPTCWLATVSVEGLFNVICVKRFWVK